jgi:hypothetical protein
VLDLKQRGIGILKRPESRFAGRPFENIRPAWLNTIGGS